MNGGLLATLLAIVVSYLLGSVPTGLLAGRLKGVDLRAVGSGNPGATNALRVLGPSVGITVFVIDVAKGAVAVLLAGLIAGHTGPLGASGLRVVCGLAAIVGNVFPVFAGFKGGKGVATATGVFLALAPLATAACFALWVVLVSLTRYVSVGSIAAAAFLPFAVNIEHSIRGSRAPASLLVLSAAVAIFVVVRHRPNIRRLVAGSENRFAWRKREDV
jgi:glycerol-3-phosphate acyltransferase PlsY